MKYISLITFLVLFCSCDQNSDNVLLKLIGKNDLGNYVIRDVIRESGFGDNVIAWKIVSDDKISERFHNNGKFKKVDDDDAKYARTLCLDIFPNIETDKFEALLNDSEENEDIYVLFAPGSNSMIIIYVEY